MKTNLRYALSWLNMSWLWMFVVLIPASCRADASLPAEAPKTVAVEPLRILEEWKTLPPPSASFFNHASVVAGNRLYLLGGNMFAVIHAEIRPDGSLGKWQSLGTLPDDIPSVNACATVCNKRVYLVGGRSKDGKNNGATAYAEVKDDGSLGEWKKTTPLPTKMSNGGLAQHKGRLYYAGGWYDRRVFSASINGDGNLGEWKEAAHFKSSRGMFSLLEYNECLFAPGGNSGHTENTVKDTVYVSKIQGDGNLANWSLDRALPVPVASNGVMAGDVIVLPGGLGEDGRTSQVWAAKIGADGSVGEWSRQSDLPRPLNSPAVSYFNGWIYVSGGLYTKENGEYGGISHTLYAAKLVPPL